MLIKIRYILFSFLICFSFPLIANDNVPRLRKNQTDSCFPTLKAQYKSLNKAIDKVNKDYSDNYLHVLFLYNYNLNLGKYPKQSNIFSSVLLQTDAAIKDAENRETSYCPNLADIYMMKGIALLYKQNYREAYRVFDSIVEYYPESKTWMNAYLWQAHTSIYMKAYDTARSILQTIAAKLDTNDIELRKRYETIFADYFIKTYDYEKALNHLLKIEQLPLPRKIQTRAKFIAGQIYNQTGNYRDAIPCYDGIISNSVGADKMMKSYAIVYKHLCEKILEEQQMSLALSVANMESIPKEFEPTVVESTHDSSFINTHYPYYFNDMAAMFFLDESVDYESNDELDYDDSTDYIDDYYESHLTNEMLEAIFENWDSISIHIPKTDFSSMTDTIYLPLLGAGAEYTLPHFNSIISRFGWRRYRYHYGIDTKNSTGDSIFCVFDGIVRIAKRNKTYGNVIIIRHYNGLETFYAHCSKLLVEPNQEVKAGELIALVGNTGRSTGPHLHFETRYKGAAFNPEYMIDFEKGKLISDTLVITKETFNYLRSGNSSSTSPSSSDAVYYKIRSGDTLSGIAQKYRTNVNSIKRLNGLKSDFIREGQRIRVL